jgi:hypothetical protein
VNLEEFFYGDFVVDAHVVELPFAGLIIQFCLVFSTNLQKEPEESALMARRRELTKLHKASRNQRIIHALATFGAEETSPGLTSTSPKLVLTVKTRLDGVHHDVQLPCCCGLIVSEKVQNSTNWRQGDWSLEVEVIAIPDNLDKFPTVLPKLKQHFLFFSYCRGSEMIVDLVFPLYHLIISSFRLESTNCQFGLLVTVVRVVGRSTSVVDSWSISS